MNSVTIVPVVEGHGEIEAVPLLIRRIASEAIPEAIFSIASPLRVHADRLRRAGELERQIENCTRRFSRDCKILILLDCDWDNCCPKQDGPTLLRRAYEYAPDVSFSVVLANKEFETWFIASATSLRGVRGLTLDLPHLDDPESIRGAKEWLRMHMPRNHPYAETDDQPKLAQAMDLSLARRSPSFDKFYREIVLMLRG